MHATRKRIARALRGHRPEHAGSRAPLPLLAIVPVVALCGALALTSDTSVSAAANAGPDSSAAAAAGSLAPVPDDRLPRSAHALPALPPLGVPARLLHATGSPGQSSQAGSATQQPEAAIVSALASSGIPLPALEAYRNAARQLAVSDPGCHLSWPLLAGIGRVESNHGRFGGAQLRADGTSTRPIIGIPLDGNGTALIRDTDHGALDGDPVYDRAVGPMQFIPSTWLEYAADGNGDGRADPFNIFDAALATARYLCVAGGNVGTSAGEQRAILSYNHSYDYLRLVVAIARDYASGTPATIPGLPPQPGSAAGAKGSTGASSQSGSGSSSSSAGKSSSAGPSTPSRSSSSAANTPGGSHGPSSSSASSPSSSGPTSSTSSSAPSSSGSSSSGSSSSASSSSGSSSSASSSSAPSSSAPTSSAPSSSSSSSASPSCTTSTATSSTASTSGSSGSQTGSSSSGNSSSTSDTTTASPSDSPCPTT